MTTDLDARFANPATTMATAARVRTVMDAWQPNPMVRSASGTGYGFGSDNAYLAAIAKHLTTRRPPGPPT